MKKQLREVRELLSDLRREAILAHISDLSFENQIGWLKKACSKINSADDLTLQDLEKFIDRLEMFKTKVQEKPNKADKELMQAVQQAKYYNRTGINPNSKEARFGGLDLEEARKGIIFPDWAKNEPSNQETQDEIIYNDNSFFGHYLRIYSKFPALSEFIGNIGQWQQIEINTRYWEKKILELKALKEVMPISADIISKIEGKLQQCGKKVDRRQKYTPQMKEEAKYFYQEHKGVADEKPSKTWIESDLIPHLAEEFDKDESFFVESSIRKDWLGLTS